MKLKKLFAGILAVAMMATMAAPAFAAKASSVTTTAGTQQDFEDVDSITLEKNYILTNESTTSPAETIKFEVTPTSVKNAAKNINTTNMPIVTVDDLVLTAGAAGGEKQTTTINLPTYTSVGVYTYSITEKDGNVAGVTYNTKPITLVVSVLNGDDGGLVRIPALHVGDTKSTTIENTYSAGTLTIAKEVKGTLGNKSKDFEFTLTLTGVAGKTYADSYAVTATAPNDTTLHNPETITIGTPVTVYLHDGAQLNIANLPYGVTYTITEKDYTGAGEDDDHGYTTKIGTEEILTKTAEIKESANAVTFTNSKGGVVDTGVILDNAPYIALMMVVVAGAAVMIIKKRRHFED